MDIVINEEECLVRIIQNFLTPSAAEHYFVTLAASLPWAQEQSRLYGKIHPLPRLTAWVGEVHYRYSGVEHAPTPMPAELHELVDRVAQLVPRPNGVLGNLYRTGLDHVSWHADDEPIFGPDPAIASLSLGATRTFKLRNQTTREVTTIDLKAGSLLVMEGATQARFQHSLPKRVRVQEPRINLTFRRIV